MKREIRTLKGKDYLFDTKENCVCLTRFDLETAEAMLDSLTDCTCCVNCKGCIKCVSCVDCTDCLACNDCEGCEAIAAYRDLKDPKRYVIDVTDEELTSQAIQERIFKLGGSWYEGCKEVHSTDVAGLFIDEQLIMSHCDNIKISSDYKLISAETFFKLF